MEQSNVCLAARSTTSCLDDRIELAYSNEHSLTINQSKDHFDLDHIPADATTDFALTVEKSKKCSEVNQMLTDTADHHSVTMEEQNDSMDGSVASSDDTDDYSFTTEKPNEYLDVKQMVDNTADVEGHLVEQTQLEDLEAVSDIGTDRYAFSMRASNAANDISSSGDKAFILNGALEQGNMSPMLEVKQKEINVGKASEYTNKAQRFAPEKKRISPNEAHEYVGMDSELTSGESNVDQLWLNKSGNIGNAGQTLDWTKLNTKQMQNHHDIGLASTFAVKKSFGIEHGNEPVCTEMTIPDKLLTQGMHEQLDIDPGSAQCKGATAEGLLDFCSPIPDPKSVDGKVDVKGAHEYGTFFAASSIALDKAFSSITNKNLEPLGEGQMSASDEIMFNIEQLNKYGNLGGTTGNLDNNLSMDQPQDFVMTPTDSFKKAFPKEHSEESAEFQAMSALDLSMKAPRIEKPNEETSEITSKPATPSSLAKNECFMCHKVLTTASSLKRHMKSHTGERSWVCHICTKAFVQSGQLWIHMRTHTGEKAYECGVCHKRFAQSFHLDRHTKIHSGEKPHVCSVCNKAFTLPNNLTVHMRTHTGERPYECFVCKKTFKQSNDLVRHMRIHTGERPYECGICKKKFTQSGDLDRHSRTHRNKKRPTETDKKRFAELENDKKYSAEVVNDNKHSMEAENDNKHPVEAENDNKHPLEAGNDNKHPVEAENGNKHPVEAENDNKHPMEAGNGGKHPMEAENGNKHPVEAENDNKHPMEAGNGSKHPMEAGNGNKHPVEAENDNKHPMEAGNGSKHPMEAENGNKHPMEAENGSKHSMEAGNGSKHPMEAGND